ncbi:MAG: CBS domain-containing protein [Planctomycetota bacterium]
MGDQEISPLTGPTKNAFLRHLLLDIEALETMISDGMIESGKIRIGAEQEFCLVQPDLRPARTGPEVLASISDPHFTSELALWNLEINLDPCDAEAGCFSRMENQLNQLLNRANNAARNLDGRIILTGILPTIRKSELDFKYMTPNPRYRILDSIMKELRGEDFSLYIEGVEEVNLKHSSILFEACNTSFQIHMQVSPENFADQYNWAQVLAGPVLAACVNSPLLLGKELWSETRIALFRQSIEIRHAGNYIRDKQPRVAFGHDWIHASAAEIFKNDIACYKLIISAAIESKSSIDILAEGRIPELRAMNLHNGTLYKWNRACYGVGNGKPHLRIENRYIPAGPTPHDEIANLVFWIGLMMALPDRCRGQWASHFYFQDVRCNFLKAARNGLSNEFKWFGQSLDASKLILEILLPMAEVGLTQLGIAKHEFSIFLDTIEQRVRSRQTGAEWMIQSFRNLREKNSVNESMLMLTQFMQDHCLEKRPGHLWEVPNQRTLFQIPDRYQRVDSIMYTDLITVREDDLLDFAGKLMKWNEIDYVPVENMRGELTGIVSRNDIAQIQSDSKNPELMVGDAMTINIITVIPEMTIEHAEKTMQASGFGSLPVVRDNRVIGIVTMSQINELKKDEIE